MLRFSAIGTADIRQSLRWEISDDQRAAARRGTERRSLWILAGEGAACPPPLAA
jgi:hypothetical protein